MWAAWLQVAHVVGDVAFLQPEGAPGVPRGWAAAQVATSADFSHGSFFWTHISGGLNYQVRLLALPRRCLGLCMAYIQTLPQPGLSRE